MGSSRLKSLNLNLRDKPKEDSEIAMFVEQLKSLLTTISKTTLQKIQKNLIKSSQKLTSLREPDLLQNSQKKPCSEKMCLLVEYFHENLPTVAKEENMERNFTLWREILREEVRNPVVIANSKPFFHSEVKS